MTLEQKINADIKTAMLNKDKEVLESLRAMKSALQLLKASKTAPADVDSEAAAVAALQKLVKQRQEAAEIYAGQGRQDLADEERKQASIIERYLPQQLSRDEIEARLKEVVAQVGASGPRDMGKVMGVATKLFAGQADNRVVSEIVKQMLSL